jgi:hypothetical protein
MPAMDECMQGGAWCNSAKTCQLTKSSGRGSSDHMDKEIPFTGIMSSSPAVNPGLTRFNLSIHRLLMSSSPMLINTYEHTYVQISTTGTG